MPRSPPREALAALALLAALLLAGCSSPAEQQPSTSRQDVRERFEVGPGRGVEWKLFMEQGQAIQYSWNAAQSVYFDFHGERPGAPADDFTSHRTGTRASDTGAFEAPFTWRHGWYWENRQTRTLTIEVEVRGVFAVVGRTA
jgi:hypothetical protein